MVVAVHSMNVPPVELLALGIGIGDPALHRFGQQSVERGDVGKPARTLQGFEKVARRDVGLPLVGMELKELLACGGTAQAAQHAELAVVNVGNIGAAVLAGGAGVELDDIVEETQ